MWKSTPRMRPGGCSPQAAQAWFIFGQQGNALELPEQLMQDRRRKSPPGPVQMHADKPSFLRKTGLLLAGLLAFAAIVRLAKIGVPSLWGDELYSVSFSRIPMDMLWGDWMVRETNPPLFYSILKGWIALFGEQDVALRVLTIIVGLAGIGGIFLFVRALHSTQAALLAVALAAVSSRQVA